MAHPISVLGFQHWGEKMIQSPCSFFLHAPMETANRCAHHYRKFYAAEYCNILCRINVQAATCKSSQILLTSLSAAICISRTARSGLWCGFKLPIFSLTLIKNKLEPWH